MTFTVAVAQIGSLPTDPLATAHKAAATLREAAEAQAHALGGQRAHRTPVTARRLAA